MDIKRKYRELLSKLHPDKNTPYSDKYHFDKVKKAFDRINCYFSNEEDSTQITGEIIHNFLDDLKHYKWFKLI